MTYWVVLYLKPESIDYTGPLKWKIAQGKFERVCDPAVNMIQFGDSVYRLDDKKIFSIEHTNQERTHSFLVCEAHKLRQPE